MREKTYQYTIFGLGISGMSAAKYLAHKGKRVCVVDNNEAPQLKAELEALKIPGFFGDAACAQLLNCQTIVVSPGIDLRSASLKKAAEQGVEIIGDVEIFARDVDKPYIAITGSNGKSTVVSMLGEILTNAGVNAVVCGNIGLPVLDALTQDADCYVLELSSFQLDSTRSLKAEVASIINISDDHLDRYLGFEEYTLSKQSIYNNCVKAVYYEDQTNCAPLSSSLVGEALCLNQDSLFHLQGRSSDVCLMYKADKIIALSDMSLAGSHNAKNALLACAIAKEFNCVSAQMRDCLRNFQGLPYRCALEVQWRGIDFVNDSKGTNVGATISAIESFSSSANRVLLIAGGVGKGADFSELQASIVKHVHCVVVIGVDGAQITAGLPKSINCSGADDLSQALRISVSQAAAGDVILFSPACASFDMFDNYLHRGQSFSYAVNDLVGGANA